MKYPYDLPMKHKLPSSPWCVVQVSLEKKLVDDVAIEEDLQVTAGSVMKNVVAQIWVLTKPQNMWI